MCASTRAYLIRRFLLLSVASIFMPGCPTVPDSGNGNGNDNGGTGTGPITGDIISVRTDRQISALDSFISILYTVSNAPSTSEVEAYFVPVIGTPPNLVEDGSRVIIDSGLPVGASQAFQFTPSVAGVGNYQVGLVVTPPTGSAVEIKSNGRIQVLGPPNPTFIQPLESPTEAPRGTSVFVSFDVGDPEDDAQWRLFLLSETDSRDVPADQLGTELNTGRGNVGSFSVGTDELNPGDYQLGLSATDSGDSVARTVANGENEKIITNTNGPIIRVTEVVVTTPPTIRVTAPGSAGVTLFRNEPYTVRFEAALGEPATAASIEVFYDNNSSAADGFLDFLPNAENLPVTATSASFPTDLAEGTYFVGATIRQQGQTPLTSYATGTVRVVRQATLVVSEPNTLLPIAPGVPGDEDTQTATIRWQTNVPPSAARADVYAQRLDINGQVTGSEIPILTDAELTVTTAEFASASSGLFRVFVRLDFNDTLVTDITVSAPLPVRVTSLPRVLWLGSLDEADPPFEGAIFEGVNFEDNAGSALSPAGDLNGDGLDDFVIGARYGKPFFVNPSGVGPGEAYLVYGGSGSRELLGSYNLNSVGTTSLRGVTLTGIPTVDVLNENTDGLSDVTVIPDVDADGLGELVFGFPFTESAGATVGPLEAEGQCTRGCAVVLSSNNTILNEPGSGTPVVALNRVGQAFSDFTIINETSVLVTDQLTFQEGDSNANPPTADACVTGTDGIPDTVVAPSIGFSDVLAPPLYAILGFEPIPAGTPPAPGVCVTQFNVPDCADVFGSLDFSGLFAGTGFYIGMATPVEPRGARLVGANVNSRLGTSVTFSYASEGSTAADLILSAPGDAATPDIVDGITNTITESGLAFLADNRNLWANQGGRTPPTPHQYVVGFTSHCGDNRAEGVTDVVLLAGNTNDSIENVLGIDDFNNDRRNDIAVGAPNAGGGAGRVYVAFRREQALEGDFVLNKLELAPTDPERLTGVLIVSQSVAAFGASLATGVDFNGDGTSDLVVGSPDASNRVGEVLIVFGDPNLVSPAGGISVSTLLTSRNAQGRPRAVRITGNALDTNGQFGFNVANAGDVDGDGLNDLLIAAPNATPRFDPNPTDANDVLSTPGIDANFDGISDTTQDVTSAGLVYIVSSRNRLDQIRTCSQSGRVCSSNADCATGQVCQTPANMSVSIDQLGSSQLAGAMVAGIRAGDRIGGGDAGDESAGGIPGKLGRGRSFGLSTAGDVDGDGRDDILIGSVLADPRRDPNTDVGVQNAGEAYLVYGSAAP